MVPAKPLYTKVLSHKHLTFGKKIYVGDVHLRLWALTGQSANISLSSKGLRKPHWCNSHSVVFTSRPYSIAFFLIVNKIKKLIAQTWILCWTVATKVIVYYRLWNHYMYTKVYKSNSRFNSLWGLGTGVAMLSICLDQEFLYHVWAIFSQS